MRRAFTCLGVFLILLLVSAILLAGVGTNTVRRSFPRVDGEISLSGLDGSVEILRDVSGVPHIYAGSTHDLFFAQGYAHAQDRFWQMDFWRHISGGRLSELFGESQLETDRFLRTLGWARVAQQEWETVDAEGRLILEAYAEGVNAYLADHSGSSLSLEYAVLNLTNPGYRPEPWHPVHSLAWAKVMAWDLGENMDEEITRAILLRQFSPEQLAELYPPYPEDAPVIVPGPYPYAVSPAQREKAPSLLPEEALPALRRTGRAIAALQKLLGPGGSGIGSNNWVISGKRTASGSPILANDPHLAVQMPSIWYEAALHCMPQRADCPYQVAGFTFAGAPGVIVGHTDRIAWGVTNVGPDVQDLFIERINPQNPNQYEYQGEWVDMQVLEETLQVAGGAPEILTVRYTRHGPIISETYGMLEGFTGQAGIELPEQYAIALSWTALEPNTTFQAIWKLDQARDWEDFREAAASFNVPSQNLVYADVDGNIGYQMPGHIPLRSRGDGGLPAPGWSGDWEWQGYIPFEQLPHLYNPPEGFIVTANHAVVDSRYPYLITTDWDYGTRAIRIRELIEKTPRPLDLEAMAAIQGDNRNLNAAALTPLLLEIPLDEPQLEQARLILQDWDYQNALDSAPAALFEAFWKHLLAAAFHDELPEDFWPTGGGRWFTVIQRLAQDPDNPWWDDLRTQEREGRDAIFRRAFGAAVAELSSLQSVDPRDWHWGGLHTVTFRNASLGKSGIAPIEALFNRGPYAASGGSGIVNATSYNAAKDYTVSWLPSMRMIVDLGDLENSRAINTLGQSGHAYHAHYADMIEDWRAIRYHPMHWARSVIEAEAGGRLVLQPK